MKKISSFILGVFLLVQMTPSFVWGFDGGFVWDNNYFVTTDFWDNNPSDSDVMDAFWGGGIIGTNPTIYTELWSGGNSCDISNMAVVYIDPGEDTIPVDLSSDTTYVLGSGTYFLTRSSQLSNDTCVALVSEGADIRIATGSDVTMFDVVSSHYLIFEGVSLGGHTNDFVCGQAGYETQEACLGAGSCSDSTYNDNQSGCEANGLCSNTSYTTEESCMSAGVCSDIQYTGYDACMEAGFCYEDHQDHSVIFSTQESCEAVEVNDYYCDSSYDIITQTECESVYSCSNPDYFTQSECESAYVCSNSSYTTQVDCEANGFCSDSSYTTQVDCEAEGFCPWGEYTDEATCSLYGACNDGISNVTQSFCENNHCSNPNYLDQTSCESNYACYVGSIFHPEISQEDCSGGKLSWKLNSWLPGNLWTQYSWTRNFWTDYVWQSASYTRSQNSWQNWNRSPVNPYPVWDTNTWSTSWSDNSFTNFDYSWDEAVNSYGFEISYSTKITWNNVEVYFQDVALYADNSDDLLFNASQFYSNVDGLDLNTVDDVVLNNLQIFDNSNYGVNLDVNSTNVAVNNSHFFRNNYGIRLYALNSIVHNCLFTNNERGLGLSNSDINTHDLMLVNNTKGVSLTDYHPEYFGDQSYGENSEDVEWAGGSQPPASPYADGNNGYLGWGNGNDISLGSVVSPNYTVNVVSSGVYLNEWEGVEESSLRGYNSAWTKYKVRNYSYGSAMMNQSQPMAYSGSTFVYYGVDGYEYDSAKFVGQSVLAPIYCFNSLGNLVQFGDESICFGVPSDGGLLASDGITNISFGDLQKGIFVKLTPAFKNTDFTMKALSAGDSDIKTKMGIFPRPSREYLNSEEIIQLKQINLVPFKVVQTQEVLNSIIDGASFVD